MSGIVGLMERQGRPVVESELQAMQARMAHWGPDGADKCCLGSGGLGNLLLHNTPEAVYEQLPLTSFDGRFVLTAEARLDNRESLCDTFAISVGERTTVPDGQLILRAYQKWGEDSPNHLLGDWSFAAWHPREQRLFLARDQTGVTGVYYFANERRFAFASDLHALLELHDAPRQINELILGQILVVCPAFNGPNSIVRDIFRLPPAHAMSVTQGQVRTWKYYTLEDAPDLQFRSEDDLREQFLHHYSEAVRARLRSLRPIGVTLSGGLDSGSVAALASRELKQRDGVNSLTAFTSIPAFHVASCDRRHRFGDEWPYASAVARAAAIPVHIGIDGTRVSPIMGIRRTLLAHHAPGHASGNTFWIWDLLDQARERGIGTLLTGQGGNATVSWRGFTPALNALQLLRRGRIHSAADRIARGMLPKRWHMNLRSLMANRDFQMIDQPWRGYAAVRPEFARRMKLADWISTHGYNPHGGAGFANAREARCAMIRPSSSIGGALWSENGAMAGMEIRDPTLDMRLIEFCLGVPDHFHTSQNGTDRWVIRRAMERVLPDEVRLNQRIGRQAADIVPRIKHGREEVEAEFASVTKSQLAAELLDLGHMRKTLDRILSKDDLSAKTACDSIFLRGLMVGMFVRDWEQASRSVMPQLETLGAA